VANAKEGRVEERKVPASLSVVVPCYNEASNLPALHRRLSAVLSAIPAPREILFVDDGSTDGTRSAIEALAAEDPSVKFLSFSRNFGHEAASTAGLDAAGGEAVVLIDADLQDPPELIPALLSKWAEGYDVVYAVRRSRDGESLLKRGTSHLFYRLVNVLSAQPLPVDTGDFRLVDRKALEAFRECREVNRFVRGLSTWVGFRQAGVPYDRERRLEGRTSYGYGKLLLLAIEAVSSFSVAPLRLALLLGAAGILLGGALAAAVLVQKLRYGVNPQGYTLLMLTVVFMGSLNLLLLGIVAEYLGKVFLETRRRPLYIVDRASEGLKHRTYG
jgi:glycosyltransferase involved in cell wall biosynthesis